MVTRLLADLGADVLKVEPPGGSPGRHVRPTLAGTSIGFAMHNANKRSAVLNPLDESDRRRFLDLAASADIVVDCGLPGQAAAYGASCAELADRYRHLVALSITDFGAAGPRSSWRATDPVLYAMSGALSRSGPTAGTPVLPPDGIASATAAVQAAWAVLVAYFNRLRCGTGDYIDFSRFDAVVMALDPPFGAHGQVAAGIRSTGRWRGRPKNQDAYPIYPCRDGYVRFCVMAPRQWRGLRRWLGEPEDFQDPKYDVIGARLAAWPQISVLVAKLCAEKTMKELVAAGQALGVPITAVLTPSRILASEHFQAVGAITDAELVPGVRTGVPTGYFVVDGKRAGFRTPAPAAGQDEPRWLADPAPVPPPSGRVGGYPFEGLRIQRSDLPQAARHDRGRDRTPNQRARNVRAGRHCLSGLAGVVRRRSADCPSGSEIDVLPACSCFICEAPIWAHRGDAFGQLKLFDPQAGGAPPRSAARSARSVRGRRARPNCPAPPRAVPRPASSPG